MKASNEVRTKQPVEPGQKMSELFPNSWNHIPNQVRGQFHEIPRQQAILDLLQQALDTHGPDNRIHNIITGNPGVGKTVLCNEFLRRNPCYWSIEGDDKILIRPVVYTILPRDAGPRITMSFIAGAMGIKDYVTMTEAKLIKSVVEFIEKHRVKMIMIEETQQARTSLDNALKDVRQALKDLDSRSKVCLTLLGILGSEDIISTEQQMDNRFSGLHVLDEFRMGNGGEVNDFVEFLDKVDREITDVCSGLTEDIRRARVYAASKGNPRKLMTLLGYAAMFAINSGSPKISDAHLAQSFDQHLSFWARLNLNPFSCSEQELARLDFMQATKLVKK